MLDKKKYNFNDTTWLAVVTIDDRLDRSSSVTMFYGSKINCKEFFLGYRKGEYDYTEYSNDVLLNNKNRDFDPADIFDRYIELSEIYCKDLLKGTTLFKEENKTLKKKRI